MTMLRRAAWWFISQGPIILAFILLAVGGLGSAVFQVLDEANEARHDKDQQAEVDALRAELECRARESSEATRLGDELDRVGWPALSQVVLSDDDTATRHDAERIAEIARELGPALERRAEAVATCD